MVKCSFPKYYYILHMLSKPSSFIAQVPFRCHLCIFGDFISVCDVSCYFSWMLCYYYYVYFIILGFLMEAVYRMKYGALYLFKKVLLETGQTVLANTVPAKAVPLVMGDGSSESEVVMGMNNRETEQQLVYSSDNWYNVCIPCRT